jgi:ABC-type bacteriocin/lantibiotic exporter with double-glycine peptidase domain
MPEQDDQSADSDDSDREIWRVGNRCGINSVYVLLRLLGRPVSYDVTAAAFPVRSVGQSIGEMQDFMQSQGVPSEVVMVTPERLRQCPLPAIALLEVDKAEGGHFVVILSVQHDGVWIVDGTSAALNFMPSEEFFREWRGYLLIQNSRFAGLRWLYAVAIAIGTANVTYSVWSELVRRRSRCAPTTAG